MDNLGSFLWCNTIIILEKWYAIQMQLRKGFEPIVNIPYPKNHYTKLIEE